MNWDVSGVDPALRSRAEAAARRAGVSVGAWLSQTILASILMPRERPQGSALHSPSHPPRRLLRSSMLGFVLGVIIVVGSIAGFAYILGQDQRARSSQRPSVVRAEPRTAPGTDRANPPSADAARLASLRAAAAASDFAAQTDLGRIYLEGKGVPADPTIAAGLFEEAAVQGYADAQYELGMLYQEGRGREKDTALAFFWQDSAAARGSVPAAYQLGVFYAEGRGTPQDFGRAASWFRRAANAGNARAAFALGFLYEQGLGVAVDADEARRWWTRAAQAGNVDARARLDGRDAPAPFALGPHIGSAATPSSSSAPLGTDDIAEIQRLLKLLSFDPGATDGRITPQTTDAIRSYQKIAGFDSDGKPTLELLSSLRAVAGTSQSR